MKLIVVYDLDKEFDNLQRGLKTQHSPDHQPKMVREMMAEGIDLQSKEAVNIFIQNKIESEQIDTAKAAAEIQEKWNNISDEVTRSMDSLFVTQDPFDEITAYLSLNGRCAYNFPDRYFFVCITRPAPIGTIIHELLHFYTHLLIRPLFLEQGAEDKFPEFKEALTVLLNTEFKEIIEEPDAGYEKHVESRQWILDHWQRDMKIPELSKQYITK